MQHQSDSCCATQHINTLHVNAHAGSMLQDWHCGLQMILTVHVKYDILKAMTTLVYTVHMGGRPIWDTTAALCLIWFCLDVLLDAALHS